MTIDGGFVADEPQSFLLTTAAGISVFCGGDTSLSDDLRTRGELYRADWTAPVILEALIPGRMQSHASTAEVPRRAARARGEDGARDP
jgi:hypothetical protein